MTDRHDTNGTAAKDLGPMAASTKAHNWVVPGAVYLVTGGSGALARHLADHIRSKADATVALLSRQSVSGNQTGVVHLKADVTDRGALDSALRALRQEHGPIRGVFHLAGLTEDRALTQKSFAEFDRVLAPKIAGLRCLDQATASDPLDMFVGFSSVAAIIGNPGQADYAVANAFLDRYLQSRQKRVLAGTARGRSLSINWPYWADGGIHPRDGRDPTLGHSSGIVALSLGTGFAALDKALAQGSSHVAVFSGDRQKLASWLAKEKPSTDAQGAGNPQPDRENRAKGQNPILALIEVLRAEISEILRFAPEEVTDSVPVSDLGLDSITYTALAERLNQLFDLTLTPPDLYDAAHIEDMAARLLDQNPRLVAGLEIDVASTEAPTPTEAAVPAAPISEPFASDVSHQTNATAIVGLDARFPSAASADSFWELLDQNRDAISRVPADRWKPDDPALDASAPGWGGFIDEIDRFDPLFFGISPREADWMDPQQRILLESAWYAFEDAGLRRDQIEGRAGGVFVGASSNDYGVLIAKQRAEVSAHRSTGLAHSILPNRVSHVFNLTGPSEAIDTACSSSLVAMNRAVRALRSGECEFAVVAGVNAMLSPDLFNAFNASGMLSPTGRCHTFDADADGYVRGEGVGTLILMPLHEAVQNGLRVRAVIRGAAVNHVGHTSSLTVPSIEAQASLIRAALADSGLHPADISAIEAHGTGTSLGDPIEIGGLKSVFAQASDGEIVITSAKSKIGHLESAAGIAGMISSVLALEAGRIPGNPGLKSQNPFIDLTGTPLRLARDSEDWVTPRDQSGRRLPRRIGVSSFGFGGTNGHVILEEAPAAQNTIPLSGADTAVLPVMISAHSVVALKSQIEGLLSMVTASPELSAADVAHAIARRRTAFDYRAAFVAQGRDALISGLNTALASVGDDLPPCPRPGLEARATWKEELAEVTARGFGTDPRPAQRVVAAFLAGAQIDAASVFGAGGGRWVPLPRTTFDRARHWFTTTPSDAIEVSVAVDAPLIADHMVEGSGILPGAASVALLLDAAQRAGWISSMTPVQLADIKWIAPVSQRALSGGLLAERGENGSVRLLTSENLVVLSAELLLPNPVAEASSDPLSAEQNADVDSGLYAQFSDKGIAYGPAYQRLHRIERSGEKSRSALVALAEGSGPVLEIASALDAALQTAFGFADDAGGMMVPTGAANIEIFAPMADAVSAICTRQGEKSFSFELLDIHSKVVARMGQVTFEPVERLKPPQIKVYRSVWSPAAVGSPPSATPACLLVSDDAELRRTFKAHGDAVSVGGDLTALISNAMGSARLAGTVTVVDLREVQLQAPEIAALADFAQKRPGSGAMVLLLAQPAQSVCALLQSLSAELDGFWAKTVVSDLSDPIALTAMLLAECTQPETAEILWNDGHRSERSLRELPVPDATETIIPAGAVCMITGGLGGIGRALATDLRKKFDARVIVSARNPDKSATPDWISTDPGISLVQCDVTVRQQVGDTVSDIVARYGRLTHVFHLAGLLCDKPADALSVEDFEIALAPKLAGLQNLVAATKAHDVKRIVAFSSAAAVFGSAGQAAYGAANGAMADLARSLDASSPVSVIDWPLWADGGMTSERLESAYSAQGLATLNSEEAFKLLYRLMAGPNGQFTVAKTQAAAPVEISLTRKSDSALEQVQSFDAPMPADELEAFLRQEICDVLQMSQNRLHAAEPLDRYGLDSSLMLELTARLEQRFGKIPKTVFFEYPSLTALAGFLSGRPVVAASETGQAESADPVSEAAAPLPAQPVPHRATTTQQMPVAIIGMSGRFPGADTLDEFWQNLAEGRDCISAIPANRWDQDSYFNKDQTQKGAVYLSEGGFISGHDEFDPGFFRIPTRDAKRIDPQERLFLMESWRAFENAGYPPRRLHRETGGKVGVFAGVMWSEYQLFGRFDGPMQDRISLGASFASIANRTSFFFGLNGPSLGLDTMCSSSLSALHLACSALQLGECQMALAGGVNLSLHPNKYLQLSQSGFAAPDGRCRSFGTGGAGYGPGEGVGVALLRPLSEAVAAGDRILGVIRGSAVNHGGAVTGYTVPNPKAQAEVISDAWKRSGLDPKLVDYIEAHGTGTPLGDPIEIRGLAMAFPSHDALPVGSVKSNVGHLEAAAGMAALAKVIGQVENQQLSPTIHTDPLNPDLEIAGTGLKIQTKLEPWTRRTIDGEAQPYRVGISSFGAGGSNAHIVFEEYRASQPAKDVTSPQPSVILLSARSQAALEQRLIDLADWLDRASDVRLADIAYTSAIGRRHFERRFAIIANTTVQLRDAIGAILSGQPGPECFSTEFLRNDTENDVRSDIVRMAQAYIANPKDEEPPTGEWAGRLLPLPSYPFETKRVWVDPPASTVAISRSAVAVPPVAARAAEPSMPQAPRDLQQSNLHENDPMSEHKAPAAVTSGTRTVVRDVLMRVLEEDLEPASMSKPFADLGIDSIHAVQIARLLGEALGREIPVAELYNFATADRLADFLDQETAENHPAPSAKKAPRPAIAERAVSQDNVVRTDGADISLAVQQVRSALAEVLEEDPNDLDTNRPFQEIGLDSVHGVQIARRLSNEGREVTAMMLYDFPTIQRLAAHIATLGGNAISVADPAQGRASNENDQPLGTIDSGDAAQADTPGALPLSVRLNAAAAPVRRRKNGVRLAPVDGPAQTDAQSEEAQPGPVLQPGQRRRKAALIRSLDYLEQVDYVDDTIDAPDADMVEIAVSASSISLSDLMRMRGIYPEMPTYPFAAGVEVAGVVTRVGYNVDSVSSGDRVTAMMSKTFGGHASLTHAHKEAVWVISDDMSLMDACTLPSSFLTAYYGLVDLGRVSRGETVLVHSGASALGLMAIQIVQGAGATVIATTSSDAKANYLHQHGIETVINYATEDFKDGVLRATKGKGVDIVFNMLGPDMVQRGIDCLAEGGRYLEAALGSLKAAPRLDIGSIADGKSIQSVALRSMLWKGGAAKVQSYFAILRDMVDQGRIRPLPYTAFGQDDFRSAIQHIQSRKSIGKTLILSSPEVAPAGVEVSSGSREPLPQRGSEDAEIAIIGMAGRFGSAKSTQALWQALTDKQDLVGPIPEDRKRLGFGTQSIGSFVPDIDKFDPQFFDITPKEAEWMDPQQRVLLEETWKALEDAGIAADALAGSATGVFVGARGSNYAETRAPEDTAQGMLHAFTGGLGSILAGRIAYTYDLRGPAVTLDTACSSGAVALDMAVKNLRSGECDLAIVAGVSIGTAPGLSPGDATACRAFDDRANGFVIGEGIGVLVLKRAADAQRDNDRPHGIILASATNQDGLSNGLLAPNGSAQADLLNAAWTQAGISADQLGMIEAHGTGTILGDPVEFSALQSTVARDTQNRRFCALGSVKSNLGHTLAAAGIVSVIKVLLSMKADQIPPSLHFELPNSHIDFENSAFFVPTRTIPWNAANGQRRIAGVSAFGFSGTNAHIVVADAPRQSRQPHSTSSEPAVFFVSAKSQSALQDRISDLREWLLANRDAQLEDLAYTLAHRRAHMPCRAAFIAASREELLAVLENPHQTPVAKDALGDMVAGYLAGENLDFRDLVPTSNGRLLDLPAYPFARRVCFRGSGQRTVLPDIKADLPESGEAKPPLFGSEQSDDHGRFIPLCFDESDFFLTDHRVAGRAVLPGVMTLDLVARLARRLPDVGDSFAIRDVVFVRPCIVADRVSARLRFSTGPKGSISVRLFALDDAGEEQICSQARIVPGADDQDRTAPIVRVAELERLCPTLHGAAECYGLICETSIHHGQSLQTIQSVNSGDVDCLSRLQIVEGSGNLDDFELHPGLLDGALQSLVGFAFDREHGDTHMPFSIDEVRQFHPLTAQTFVHLQARPAESDAKRFYDITLADPDGRVTVIIRGFMHRKVSDRPTPIDPAALPSGISGVVYVPKWRDAAEPTQGDDLHVAVTSSKDDALDQQFADALDKLGHSSVTAGLGAPNGAVPRHMKLLELLDSDDAPDAILCPWEIATPNEAPNLGNWISLLQTVGRRKGHRPLRLIVPVPDTGEAAAEKLGLSALLRTAAQEIPLLQTRFFRLAGTTPDVVQDVCRFGLADETQTTSVDMVLNLNDRPAQRRVLMPVTLPEAPKRIQVPANGCIIVTGGAGGIGRQVAHHAACVWGSNVVLIGRRDEDQQIASVLDELRGHGVRARYLALNVTDATAVNAAFAELRASFGPISGVIHCAGILGDRLLRKTDLDAFAKTAAPKADAVGILDQATRQDKLAFFVTMSSLGGLTGNAGQAAYTYGSGVMDARIVQRQIDVAKRQAYGRSLTLNWPLWADGSMSVDAQSETYMRQSLGLVPMPGAYAIRLLELALSTDDPQIGVLVGDTRKVATFFEQEAQDEHSPVTAVSARRVAQAGQPNSGKALVPVLIELVAETTGWSENDLDPTEDLSAFGLDSVMLTGLTNAINARFGIQLPPAEAFAHPTIDALAECLAANHSVTIPGSAAGVAAQSTDTEAATAHGADVFDAPAIHSSASHGGAEIAVIGQSARYPMAATLEKFWENLAAGRNCVGQVPATRWTGPRFSIKDQPELSKFGGFLDDITHFEPAFFGISPAEAEMMDPQERLYLETAHCTFENAGYGRNRLKKMLNGEVGVFTGVMWSEFQLFSNPEQGEFGSSISTLSNRVSFYYDLTGPSLALDTMCSSSLTALHLACQSLQSGECRAALVGGVNMSLHQNKYTRLARNRFMAEDGKCKAFGADGTGYVPGEGVGAVFLKPLEAAQNDGDFIHAVIKGTAVNHGGRTSGFTVPNGDAQANVVSRALDAARVDPASITYLEAHGTGTPLGDPVEIYGLARSFGDAPVGRCAIGSVKTNIGHLEAAAGMAGLHKVILQMQHGQIAPSLHANPPNPNIDFASSPFRVAETLSPWPSDSPRRAGLSSFGAGGANAHVVLEEAPRATVRDVADTGPHLIMLSARTPMSLQDYAAELARFVQAEGRDAALADIAKTLCVGRDQMRVRYAFVCDDKRQLVQNLTLLAEGNRDQLAYARLKSMVSGREMPVSGSGSLADLARQWIEGETLNGEGLPGRIVPLPAYQFDRKPYWIDGSDYGQTTRQSAPILKQDLMLKDGYVSVLVKCSDPIARDHVISGRMILAGASVLELGRAGAEMLAGRPIHGLDGITWIAPAMLGDDETLTLKASIKPGEGVDTLTVENAASGQKLCQAKLRLTPPESSPDRIELGVLQARCSDALDCERTYCDLAARGYAYGPLFRALTSLHTGEREALGRLELPPDLCGDVDRYRLHPAILDGAFQSVLGVLLGRGGAESTAPYLPFHIGKVTIHERTTAGPIWVHARMQQSDDARNVSFDLTLFSQDGRVIAEIERFMLRVLRPTGEQAATSQKEAPEMPVSHETRVVPSGALKKTVETFFCETLKLPREDVTPDLLLEECGLDSIILFELTRMIEESFGAEIVPSELVGLTTLQELLDALGNAVGQEHPTAIAKATDARQPAPAFEAKPSAQPQSQSAVVARKVAIIGMSCRLPESMNEDEFWDHLLNNRNLITEAPADRWDWRDSFDPKKGVPGKSYSKWNGFCSLFGAYDVGRFKIPVEHAKHMDPQQLLMLELARDAMENAGYRPEEFAGQDTAVILGAAGRSVEERDEALKQKAVVVSKIQNMIAARISDFFDLHGTSYTMDTACSSSLVALHDACRIIQTGDATTALAGGVVIFTTDRANIGFAQAQVLSDDGNCYVFDKRAKGIVLSEGAGLFLLKDYEQALADGDNIRAVISASAVNNDGKTMGLTTPNGEMQRAVILKALRNGQIDPRTITFLEAHGTGTLLGDPIEIKAATQAYRDFTQDKGYCGVASVKANVGHMLLASGVASVVKVVKALETGILPATLHCESPHPRFNFPETPFYPLQRQEKWNPDCGLRRAAVSAFGFGGTNCHMIFDAFDASEQNHVVLRSPLPRTQYNRVAIWPQLGVTYPKPVAPASPATEQEAKPQNLEEILCALQSGSCSVETALKLHQQLHAADV